MELDITKLPEPEDYTITPCGTLVAQLGVGKVEGKFLGEFSDYDGAMETIKEDMEANQFWPNIWIVSDHGNWELVS